MPSNSHRAKNITDAILEFIIKDLRPFSVVSIDGFRNMIEVLDPTYILPSRQHFSDVALPKLYDKVKNTVMQELEQADHISLTTDGWTSRATESYITVTSCHIDNCWRIRYFVLQTSALPESHTGQNIAAVLVDAIEEWKLATVTMPSLVTDNAANMFVAAREAHIDHHITCFAHTLNLACSKALKIASVSKLLARMRRMVSFFHRSTTAAAVLKQKQKQLNLPNHKLINDCPTRWNSAVEMTERYLEQQPAVIAAMTSKELRGKADESFLSDRDITQAEELLTVLQPLKVATVALCEEKVPTVSIILPLQRQLLDHTLALKPDDSEFIKSVKRAISGDLSHRYSDDKVKNTLVKSALLDPRFKTGPFIQGGEMFCIQCNDS